jgi:DNA-binding MarR family transcriptional regulator
MIDQTVKRVLRDCPNKRLHVLFCLFAFTPAPTATDIAAEIPMDLGTTNKHLHGLERDGYAAHSGQRWFLTDKGRQLPLPGLSLPRQPMELTEQSEGNTLTLASTTTTLLNLNTDTPIEGEAEQSEGKTLTLEQPEVQSALAALHRHNIMGKTADELAHLPDMTPEYIDAIMKDTAKRGLPSYKAKGLAIRRMRDGDRVEVETDQITDRRKYIEGRYADHILY